jgi:hypothetical protein
VIGHLVPTLIDIGPTPGSRSVARAQSRSSNARVISAIHVENDPFLLHLHYSRSRHLLSAV